MKPKRFQQFERKVNFRSRKSMTEFLANHPFHETWGDEPHFSNNVKIHSLRGLTGEQEEKLYRLSSLFDFYEQLNAMMEGNPTIAGFKAEFRGRSGGNIELVPVDPPTFYDVEFEELELWQLRHLAHTVQNFDRLCDDVINFALNYGG